MPTPTRESVAETLRAQGINPTRQRVEIAMVLFSRHAHWSADQVLAGVNISHPETSRATVYNTLKLFVDKGLIREVIVDASRVFFDSNVSPHYHLYDVDSGQITDIEASALTVSGAPALPPGVITEGMDIIIRIRRDKSANAR